MVGKTNNVNIETATNFFNGKFSKAIPQNCGCHSYPELLQAALLEGDPYVERFTAQPRILLMTYVWKKRVVQYRPDFLIYTQNAKKKGLVIEVKSDASYDSFIVGKATLIKPWCESKGYDYVVKKNSEILDHQILAENWLHISRYLISAESYANMADISRRLYELIQDHEHLSLGKILNHYAHLPSNWVRAGLYKLLQQGVIQADLGQEPVNSRTLIYHA